jgi:hypothetical protein
MNVECRSITGKASLLPKTWRLTLVPTQHPIQWFHSALSPGGKQVGWEPEHSPPSKATIMNLWRYIPVTPLAITAKHSDNFTVTLPPLKIVSNILQTYRLCKLRFCHQLRIETKSFHSAINLLLIWFYNFNRRSWWLTGTAMPQVLHTDGTSIFVTCVTVSFYHALSDRWIQTFQTNRPLPPSRMGCMSP